MAEDVFEMYLREMKEIKSCDKTENESLIRQLKEGNTAVRSRLIEGNLKMVLELTREYLNQGVPAGDLVQEANMALVLAVQEYKDGNFEEFLRKQVKEVLLAAVREQSQEQKTAEKMVDRVNRLKDISQELAIKLGREATVEELAETMQVTSDEIKDIMKLTLDAMSVIGE